MRGLHAEDGLHFGLVHLDSSVVDYKSHKVVETHSKLLGIQLHPIALENSKYISHVSRVCDILFAFNNYVIYINFYIVPNKV